MNMQPTYVTFEQAKLLKEKDFDVLVNAYFEDNGGNEFFQHQYKANYNSSLSVGLTHSRPEQWQVVEWLRVNYGIWISVEGDSYGDYWYVKLTVCSEEVWEDLDKRHGILSAHRKFNNEHKSPQEAYLAAIDYVLNNLI